MFMFFFVQVPKSSEANIKSSTPLEMASYEEIPAATEEIFKATIL